jgi:hypothetical protein
LTSDISEITLTDALAPAPEFSTVPDDSCAQSCVYQQEEYNLREGSVKDDICRQFPEEDVMETKHINIESNESDRDRPANILPQAALVGKLLRDVLVHE